MGNSSGTPCSFEPSASAVTKGAAQGPTLLKRVSETRPNVTSKAEDETPFTAETEAPQPQGESVERRHSAGDSPHHTEGEELCCAAAGTNANVDVDGMESREAASRAIAAREALNNKLLLCEGHAPIGCDVVGLGSSAGDLLAELKNIYPGAPEELLESAATLCSFDDAVDMIMAGLQTSQE